MLYEIFSHCFKFSLACITFVSNCNIFGVDLFQIIFFIYMYIYKCKSIEFRVIYAYLESSWQKLLETRRFWCLWRNACLRRYQLNTHLFPNESADRAYAMGIVGLISQNKIVLLSYAINHILRLHDETVVLFQRKKKTCFDTYIYIYIYMYIHVHWKGQYATDHVCIGTLK